MLKPKITSLDDPKNKFLSVSLRWAFTIGLFIGLYYLSTVNYLLYHSIVEGYSTVIAFAIFIQGWNARRYMESGYLLYLGIAYLFVGFLDFLHFLAFKGMGIFPEETPDLPTQLWVASRYLESLSILSAFILIKRRIFDYGVLIFFTVLTGLILASIFIWGIFPECYNTVSGLTHFKIYSEYVICLVLIASLIVIYKQRELLDTQVRNLIYWSIALTIIAELTFTQYMSVYGFINMTGHLFKLLSYYLIYKAIVYTSFTRPFDLIFRELKEKDLKLQEDLATIRALEKDRDIVLSMLVHDMKTPLISIKGFSNMMLKKTGLLDADKSHEYLDVIYRQSEQLEKLIHDFLISAKSGDNRLVLNLENCDLGELLTKIAGDFKNRCEMAGLHLAVDLQNPSVTTYVDMARLHRAIGNLLDNAIRFSPHKGVISMRLQANEREFVIEIEDQGPGIPEKDMKEIFKPFFRGAGQKDTSGYGLGLAGVKTIVESHDGTITARNLPGGGALFTIAIPRKGPRNFTGEADSSHDAPDDELKRDRSAKKILVVEDNRTNRLMVMATVGKLGYEAYGAESGRDALRALATGHYDLVLMDLMMPGLDGFDATKEIRNPQSDVLDHQVPILALTASGSAGERDKAFQAGMNDYITKPVEPASLAKTLDSWLLATPN